LIASLDGSAAAPVGAVNCSSTNAKALTAANGVTMAASQSATASNGLERRWYGIAGTNWLALRIAAKLQSMIDPAITMWRKMIGRCDPMSLTSPAYSTTKVSTTAPSIIIRIAVLSHHEEISDGSGSDRSGEKPALRL
jgi:hypothetical protein